MQEAMKKALKSRRKGLALKIEVIPDQEQKEDEKNSELAPDVEDAQPIEDGDPVLMAGEPEGEQDVEGLDPMSIANSVMGKSDQTLSGKPTKTLGEKAKMEIMKIIESLNNKKA